MRAQSSGNQDPCSHGLSDLYTVISCITVPAAKPMSPCCSVSLAGCHMPNPLLLCHLGLITGMTLCTTTRLCPLGLPTPVVGNLHTCFSSDPALAVNGSGLSSMCPVTSCKFHSEFIVHKLGATTLEGRATGQSLVVVQRIISLMNVV